MNSEIPPPPRENLNDLVKVYSKANPRNNVSTPNTDAGQSNNSVGDQSREKSKYKEYLDTFVETFISNAAKPASFITIVSIFVCMIPWLKALFVITPQAHIHPAPDDQPPLSFLLDFAAYLGQAQVPLLLLLLGGTIGRLSIEDMPEGLWKTPVAVTFLNSKIEKGLFYDDKILQFITNIYYCLPTGTLLIYFTAFYASPDSKQSIQMNILALIHIAHYVCLVFCLPFTTTYTMKVSLGF